MKQFTKSGQWFHLSPLSIDVSQPINGRQF